MSNVFTKVYKHSHLEFKVDIKVSDRCHYIDVTRLPELPEEFSSKHHLDDQMCLVFFKEALIPEIGGFEPDTSVDEMVERFIENSGLQSEKFVVAEYVGRDNSSENLTPDTALDGFIEWEINFALQLMDNDPELNNVLTNILAHNIMIA